MGNPFYRWMMTGGTPIYGNHHFFKTQHPIPGLQFSTIHYEVHGPTGIVCPCACLEELQVYSSKLAALQKLKILLLYGFL